MEEKSKLELLKEKIYELKDKREERKWIKEIEYDENPLLWEIDQRRKMIRRVTGALVAITLTTSLSLTELNTDHSKEICPISRALSIVSEEASIDHQIAGIKSDYEEKDNLSVEFIDAHYVAPSGYILKGNKAYRYVEPIETTTYTVPSGYILSGTFGIKKHADGTKEIIKATKNTYYILPKGAVLTTDSEGKQIGVIEIPAEYQESSIVTKTDDEVKVLKLK